MCIRALWKAGKPLGRAADQRGTAFSGQCHIRRRYLIFRVILDFANFREIEDFAKYVSILGLSQFQVEDFSPISGRRFYCVRMDFWTGCVLGVLAYLAILNIHGFILFYGKSGLANKLRP